MGDSPAPDAHPPLIVVAGATGTGKTELSLDIAERLRERGRLAEIVNGDAMQVYRGMDIGTAKVSEDERRGVPHHLFDVLDVTDDATVAWYQAEARACIDGLLARGVVPILVGGSGLYLASVLFELEFPGTDPEVRGALEAELADHGPGMLYRRLVDADPAAAQRIGPRNGRRIVRALEVMAITGEPFSASLPGQDAWWRPTQLTILESPRDELVARLDARVVRMWEAGLVDETRALLDAGLELGTTARRAIGYAQAIAQLRGQLSPEAAIAEAQALTRKFARRQVSWFRRYETALRLDAGDPAAALQTLRAVGLES
ncbi:tRNA (adenosine(37)-N6)-dimethylallyltransferase MiaA [Pseudoclavibacter endophyticus]|uniref:tRNA dimethylallyltransferase n=1 Tax=Pseudoclavibacter endophyticus TaxID=1778590 RepID=A0A6H9WAZ7_9MICO|nr:tRNA (adenosine(37)-N6)-dimethylallyltransferase MiaA [Pseudoclavibacter endophyticus]KAB1646977.1 tRNA (adenosine(37)-N6)-dimethylallyltransferase MiaA [Pseudoclavibacter endophyticus]